MKWKTCMKRNWMTLLY